MHQVFVPRFHAGIAVVVARALAAELQGEHWSCAQRCEQRCCQQLCELLSLQLAPFPARQDSLHPTRVQQAPPLDQLGCPPHDADAALAQAVMPDGHLRPAALTILSAGNADQAGVPEQRLEQAHCVAAMEAVASCPAMMSDRLSRLGVACWVQAHCRSLQLVRHQRLDACAVARAAQLAQEHALMRSALSGQLVHALCAQPRCERPLLCAHRRRVEPAPPLQCVHAGACAEQLRLQRFSASHRCPRACGSLLHAPHAAQPHRMTRCGQQTANGCAPRDVVRRRALQSGCAACAGAAGQRTRAWQRDAT